MLCKQKFNIWYKTQPNVNEKQMLRDIRKVVSKDKKVYLPQFHVLFDVKEALWLLPSQIDTQFNHGIQTIDGSYFATKIKLYEEL